ncbi:glycosyltransferase family 2 protein [Candidatus Pacearchaeota archaeon]|nr:glycosyltransferase family 2 protein [Candidatus Pacearchaeota archaeon]
MPQHEGATKNNLKLSVIVPAYNVKDSIGKFLEELKKYIYNDKKNSYEIIVVDDGSNDGTGEILDRFEGIKVFHHMYNHGYGAALKTGFKNASGDIVIIMDSDGQHLPEDIPKFLEQIGNFDMVVGKRNRIVHSPWWRLPGKWFIECLASYLIKKRIPDLNSGFRAVWKESALKYLHLCPNGFSFSTTITLVFFNRGHSIGYVPIVSSKRRGSSRSTVSPLTGFETILLVLRIMTLFNPLRVFLPVSFVAVLIGILWGGQYVLMKRGVSVGSLLLVVTGILVFFFGLLADQIAELRKEKYE